MPSAAPQPNPASLAAAPLFIVLNAGSGHSAADETCAAIEGVLREAGRRHEVRRVEDPAELDAIAARAVADAQAAGGIVVAAGGDGTLNAVAHATLGSGCAFGVIPRGTFNYFGRTHGISADAAVAARALLDARVRPVQVGLINDRVFLVNASLGLYPQSLEDREEQKRRFGRSRLVAAWAVLVTLSRGFRPLRLLLEHAGGTRAVSALTLFVGNNRLQLERVGLREADAVEDGKLAVVLVRPLPLLALLGVVLRGAFRKLAEAPAVDHFALDDLTVRSARRPGRRFKVAMDGEVDWMTAPIRFRVAPEPLLLLEPRDAQPERGV
ncbi:diacylglycerol/lipid kinase family protein [Piscinibacter koreensis]|uniref:Diacylglycerol kinase n=1 Tax=Piscinibacter koreensis TaxID=2742824 RepID=A0A7Y6NJB8_9BURK|nr:diacylglycerol kinase family protein [Schlegelella koreensis]NUZ04222.1 diacylglycerol kinase [Schlegelella koreensis]